MLNPAAEVTDRRTVLVRERDLGDLTAPAPRHLPEPDSLLRWGRWALLPLSSAVRVRTQDHVVALTFDDGPDPAQTVGVLDELDAHGVKATFFVLAERAEQHPQIVRRMLDGGHEVALHGIDHTRLTTLPGREAARRIREGKRRLEAVTGGRVRFYRPTYGAQGMTQYLAARALGLDVVVWSAWALDWLDDEVPTVAARAVGALHPGAIVLLHDTTGEPPGAEPARPVFSRAEMTRLILEGMAQHDYSGLTAGQLLDRYPAVRAVTTQRPRLFRPDPGHDGPGAIG